MEKAVQEEKEKRKKRIKCRLIDFKHRRGHSLFLLTVSEEYLLLVYIRRHSLTVKNAQITSTDRKTVILIN